MADAIVRTKGEIGVIATVAALPKAVWTRKKVPWGRKRGAVVAILGS